MTECGPPLAFEGETTLAQLGLGDLDFAAGEANRRGSFQITAWTVRWEEFAPPGVPPRVPEGQLLCVTWADGSGLSTMLEEPFPGPGRAETEQGNGAVGLPIGVVLVGIAAAIVVSVSWLAFRRSPP